MLGDRQQTILTVFFISILVLISFVAAYSGTDQSQTLPQAIQSKHPPGESGGRDTKPYDGNTKYSYEARSISFQIECNPNCSAKNTDNDSNRTTFERAVAKFLEDPIEFIIGVIAVANMILAGLVIIQIRDSRKSSERQLRAYLFTEITEKPFFDADREILVVLRLINRGQTPAYKVTSSTIISIDTIVPTPGLKIDSPIGPIIL